MHPRRGVCTCRIGALSRGWPITQPEGCCRMRTVRTGFTSEMCRVASLEHSVLGKALFCGSPGFSGNGFWLTSLTCVKKAMLAPMSGGGMVA